MGRVVGIFTGNRAEYGLQLPIIRAVDAHPRLDYRLFLAGTHLDPAFGATRSEVERDNLHIDAEINTAPGGDTLNATPAAIGNSIVGVADALTRLRPDIFVVYADRFEGFAATIAATQMGIPTAHVEGGDVTEGGALDDSVRHAMSKLAHLHFTTNAPAANRLLAMGEEAWRVHNVGLPALDLIAAGDFAPRAAILRDLQLDPQKPIVIFTLHAIATEHEHAEEQARLALQALRLLKKDAAQIIITYPNNDAGGRRIIEVIEEAARDPESGVRVVPSLGRRRYHGLLALARDADVRVVCVGNSSSGLKETPALGCPAVNIGNRQHGRLHAANLIETGFDPEKIHQAIQRCLFDDEFRAACRRVENPYGGGNAGARIVETLATVSLGPTLIQKRMNLRGEARDGWFR
jgi:UDP-hydrolysing UDP-N-acetyl-D-glucosamine 2-epimerase